MGVWANHWSLAELKSLPTLCVGQADDLKIERNSMQVWLSRCTVADGEPYNNKVTVMIYRHRDRQWVVVEEYPAV